MFCYRFAQQTIAADKASECFFDPTHKFTYWHQLDNNWFLAVSQAREKRWF